MQLLNLFSDTSSTNIVCKCFKVNSLSKTSYEFHYSNTVGKKKNYLPNLPWALILLFRYHYWRISNLVCHFIGNSVHRRGTCIIGNLIFLLSSNGVTPNLHWTCQLNALGNQRAASVKRWKWTNWKESLTFCFPITTKIVLLKV